jgi:zinc transport system ATP-binding protein
MAVISCKNLKLGYGENIAAKDVSFDVEQGDYLCIVGENGSGKTTLMKGLLGLHKLMGGHIAFDGIRQREIGYLPQQTPIQKDFPASVQEVVLSGCLNRHKLFPFYSRADKKRVEENLKCLGIEELKNKSYRALSGGQQQRVLLARALCAADKLIVLDEPVAGLDPMMSSELYNLISRLNKEQGLTVIMVSHDMKSAVQYANKILHMGTSVVFFGQTTEYIKTDIYKKMMGEGACA